MPGKNQINQFILDKPNKSMKEHPLYKIVYFCSKSENSVMYSYERFQYDVVEKKTGKVVMSFTYTEDGDSGGWRRNGAKSVKFSDDGKYVLVTKENGKVETHKLPKNISPKPLPTKPVKKPKKNSRNSK